METVKITYIGPSREVRLPKAGRDTYKRGVANDCPRKIAETLNPEIWQVEKPAAVKPAPKSDASK